MATGRTERLAPLAGVLFAVLFAVGIITSGDVPDVDASGEEVIAQYADEGEVFIGVLTLVLAGVLLMFFAGALRERLRTAGPDWLASVAFGGATIYSVGLGIFAMSQIALIDASDLGQPEVAQALNIIDNDNFFPAVIGMAVILLATGWNVLASRSLPTWVGWLSLILGILAMAGPAGFIAFLLFPVWVLILAIILFREAPAGDRPATVIAG